MIVIEMHHSDQTFIDVVNIEDQHISGVFSFIKSQGENKAGKSI